MNPNDFVSKYGPWALITGASSGLGAEFAERLAGMGLNVLLTARRADRLQLLAERLEREYGVTARTVSADLADADCVSKIREAAKDLEIGLVVNNAGFCLTGELLQADPEGQRRMLRVNCEVPLLMAMEFGKPMRSRGKGGIIFVSSSVAFAPVPYWTHYAATKSYAMFLGEGLYHELKKSGVDVLSLCPGGMKTEFQQTAAISSFGATEVGPVVRKALRSLGRRPSVIPGLQNAFLFYWLPKLLPRRWNLSLFGLMISKIAKKSSSPHGGRSVCDRSAH